MRKRYALEAPGNNNSYTFDKARPYQMSADVLPESRSTYEDRARKRRSPFSPNLADEGNEDGAKRRGGRNKMPRRRRREDEQREQEQNTEAEGKPPRPSEEDKGLALPTPSNAREPKQPKQPGPLNRGYPY